MLWWNLSTNLNKIWESLQRSLKHDQCSFYVANQATTKYEETLVEFHCQPSVNVVLLLLLLLMMNYIVKMITVCDEKYELCSRYNFAKWVQQTQHKTQEEILLISFLLVFLLYFITFTSRLYTLWILVQTFGKYVLLLFLIF